MIIVDTNVLVAGLITNEPGAKTAQLVDALITGRIRSTLSPALLDEYRAVLLRPKLAERHGLDERAVDRLLSALVQHALWREPPPASHRAPKPGDTHLWTLLEAEPKARLITGDLRLINAPPHEDRVMRITDYSLEEN